MRNEFEGMELAVETPARMKIVHPTTKQPLLCGDDGEEAYIEMLSNDSAAMHAYNREIQDRRLSTQGRSRVTYDELVSEGVGGLAAIITGWKLANLKGEAIDLPFSRPAANRMLKAPGMRWLREQVETFAAERGNFLPASLKN